MAFNIEFEGFWRDGELDAAREKLDRLYDKLPYDSTCHMCLESGGQGYTYALDIASIPFSIHREGGSRTFDQMIEALEFEVKQRISRWHSIREVDL